MATPTKAATRWRLCVPPEGDVYYFNLDTQEAAWTLPDDLVGVVVPPFTVEDEAAVEVLLEDGGGGGGAATVDVVVAAAAPSLEPAPGRWTRVTLYQPMGVVSGRACSVRGRWIVDCMRLSCHDGLSTKCQPRPARAATHPRLRPAQQLPHLQQMGMIV
jgi:hypothetical protein